MSENPNLERDRQLLLGVQDASPLGKLGVYTRLSGPGWLQSAMTLGGGSLSNSLYLGILGGASLLWLQPFAMFVGVIMLSAISYVTLSTGLRPFRAINERINPVLGWSWLIATLVANMVWALPQYSLCFAICEQNFFPGWFQGAGFLAPGPEGGHLGKWVVSACVLAVCTTVTWSYGSGGWGIRLYELVLKLVVGMIVVCFVGVVIRMALTGDGIDWAAVLRGLAPDPRQLYKPVGGLAPLLDAIADPEARRFWSDFIVSQQRDVMLAAGATAVGINMTFLLPYSLLSRGWDKPFRGLTIFDLATGTFIPFVLATGCIVIASAQQFHAQTPDGFAVDEAGIVQPPERFVKPYQSLLEARDKAAASPRYGMGEIDDAERLVAAALVKRDTFDLARSLEKLFAAGEASSVGNVVFGVGVVGMTLSTISLMMLISGFAVCEVFDRPPEGWTFRLGCMVAAVGAFWPLLWDGDARAWLSVIASVYASMLLPIAYVTFCVMMNRRSLLGDETPRGATRLVWNGLMAVAILAATAAGVSAVWKKAGATGLAFVAAYTALVLVVQFTRKPPPAEPTAAEPTA